MHVLCYPMLTYYLKKPLQYVSEVVNRGFCYNELQFILLCYFFVEIPVLYYLMFCYNELFVTVILFVENKSELRAVITFRVIW